MNTKRLRIGISLINTVSAVDCSLKLCVLNSAVGAKYRLSGHWKLLRRSLNAAGRCQDEWENADTRSVIGTTNLMGGPTTAHFFGKISQILHAHSFGRLAILDHNWHDG